MAYTKKIEQTVAEEQNNFLDIEGMVVRSVRVVNDNTVAFTLSGKGINLYNMRLINGQNGEFIACPATKGEKDGVVEYFPQYKLYLCEKDMDYLISKVKEKLNA